MLKRVSILGYGVLSYFAFFLSFCYFIGFVGNFLVPKGIDAAPTVPFLNAVLIDIALIALFTVTHSVMARKSFKNWITRFIPQSIERSTFVLTSSVLLLAMMAHWQPLGGVIWSVENEVAIITLYSSFAIGTAMIFVASFLINHFDLFGLRQVWLAFVNKPYSELNFSTPFLYRATRHPLYLGFVIMLWSAPLMTVTHFLCASLMTTYIVIAIQFEEKDLVSSLGDKYKEYQKTVPMLIPGFKRPISTEKTNPDVA